MITHVFVNISYKLQALSKSSYLFVVSSNLVVPIYRGAEKYQMQIIKIRKQAHFEPIKNPL